MQEHHKEFWSRFQHSADVLVASRDSDQLLGVSDGFRRYLRGLDREMALSVDPDPEAHEESMLWTTAEDTLAAAHRQVTELTGRTPAPWTFCIALEEGLATLDVGGRPREFLFSWAVLSCALGTTCGGSGPLEIPERLTAGADPSGRVAVPATRRRGGILGSLTGGLESRREAFALATLHALSSLFFGHPSGDPEAAGHDD